MDEQMFWRPIATAPKDENVLVFAPDVCEPHVCMAHFEASYNNGRQWRVFMDGDWAGDVTHWMPLPAPPKE